MPGLPALDALHAEMALRGAVAGLLLFHALNLALPGPRGAQRLALIGFVLSVLAYQFCQQAEVLLFLPRALAYALLVGCVGGAAWLWVAARALFDDHFRWSAWMVLPLLAVTLLGLSANLPYFPQGDGPYRTFPPDAPVVWLGHLHALCMLLFSALALWEVTRGWRNDLVEARRVSRRWVAMGVGVYAGLALVIELALKGQAVGRLLPLLHVLGIGTIALALALLMARHSRAVVLGFGEGSAPALMPPGGESATPGPVSAGPDSDVASSVVGDVAGGMSSDPARDRASGRTSDKVTRQLQELSQAMTEGRAYRREGLSLADLAQATRMPEAALRALINQRLGFRNFNDFLHHHRLREATERLAHEDLPILSIALECGYGSIGPFNRAFKQRMGVTPTEFRAGARLAKAAGQADS